MFYQIFLSSQVKRWVIITYKYDIYELPHELLNDLRYLPDGEVNPITKDTRQIWGGKKEKKVLLLVL